MMPKGWAERINWFIIATLLSWLAAKYFSQSLYNFYHDWTGWRSVTGYSPNFLTNKLQFSSQILFFVIFFFSLRQLDKMVTLKENSSAKHATPDDQENIGKEQDYETSNNTEPRPQIENNSSEQDEKSENKDSASRNHEPILFAEDIKQAKVLGLNREEAMDFTEIKSTYRRIIAQYHPDKVGDMGPEIKEIAEAKAKEINHAYQHFRNKFQRHDKAD